MAILVGGYSALLAAAPDFNREVRPILSRYCYKCHGPDEEARKAGMRLDLRASAIKATDSGSVPIVPGHPDDSEMMARIFADDDSTRMPPQTANLELSKVQKDILKRWIASGAAYQPHWSFVAPQAPTLPKVKNAHWPRNPIDAFVLAKLEGQGLAPSRQADRFALLRRAALDLIGVQPTPAEVDAVLAEVQADKGDAGAAWDRAYARYVDRLLASPLYGERWARRWLDLARYADTNGYEKDRPRTIWPYRDWVIRALNNDMPFDRFTIEQLAGDMLPGATESQHIATGFHRNTMLNEEGGIDPQEYRFYAMVDRVGTTATTWLGLTMMCAQCHTHKFDPITQREYYQFMALMDNADEPTHDLPTPEIAAQREVRRQQIEQLTATLPQKYPVSSDVRWQPLGGKVDVKAASGVPIRKLADGSWQFVGKPSDTDTYTVTFDGDVPFDRIQLETIRENNIGPGRTPHGNFVLTDIAITAASPDEPDHPLKIKIASAKADVSQIHFPIEGAFDKDPKTGWAIDVPAGIRSQSATFFLDKKSIAAAKGGQAMRWTVRMAQNYGGQHTIGRMRLSLGSAEGKPSEDRRREALARGFAAWLERARARPAHWTILKPLEAKANVPTLTIQPDNSIYADGDASKSDQYHLKFHTDLRGLTAIRLEVLPDDRLPRRGPGRIFYEGPPGDFFLSEFKLLRGGKPQPFARALESYHGGKFSIEKAIDGDQQSGWGIDGGQGRRHVGVFVLDKPLAEAGEFEIELLCERYYAAGLGRFRIAVTTDAQPEARERLDDVERLLTVPDSALTAADRNRLQTQFLLEAPEMAAARKELNALIGSEPEYQTTLVMQERPDANQRPTYVHHRGEYLQTTKRVEPGTVSFLPQMPKGEPRNRLTLARWLVARDNPLTARVTVNRQWAAFFGLGLVRTVGDFGSQGEPPTHPELLDWLAVQFTNDGWSMKKLHRLIVTSATYRQTSLVTPELLNADAENRLLARGPRFRLEAELVRDSVLKAAGLLSAKMYGPSVFPPQPPTITTEGAYGPMTWTVSRGEDRYRRSLYTFAKRSAPFASFLTFDAPTGEVCIARRDVSNTPLQALTLLNSEMFFEPAQVLGRRFAESSVPMESRLTELFRRALVRPPEPQEIAALTAFFHQQLERMKAGKLDPKPIVGDGKGDVAARAAWTLTARAVLNLDEMITKE